MSNENHPHFSNIGEMIRYLVLEKHINVNDLTKKMGVTQRYLSKLESGHLDPTMEQVDVLKSYLKEA
ncbi:MAG: helix-turn-helix transcriptional regulator [Candidatus Omnitrophica bacterium]|nr:helix-turn-helix transcriptional regulator [Candidatus Omnitrophota bacterium]